MSDLPGDSRYRHYLSLWFPAAVLGSLLLVVLVIQLVLSWKSHERLAPVNRHLAQITRLQGVNLELQRELLESLSGEGELTAAERQQLYRELGAILAMQAHLAAGTPQALADTQAALAGDSLPTRQALAHALSHLRTVLDEEAGAHAQLIDAVNRAMTMELRIVTVALFVFPAGAILLIYLLRRRILRPLDHLGYLMTLLARRNFSPAPVAAIDPLLRPLTENYNTLVTRLAKLEAEHALREQDLQEQVESATHALLEQQRTLANTERLAAVGEMMARIAHELRNPLAGVKLACTNLRQDLAQRREAGEFGERVDVIAGEIDRIVALLNSLLDQSRHSPEAAREVTVARAVADVVALARYQVPARVQIEQRIAGSLVCRLPQVLFSQALLNLLMNAGQALGEAGGRIVIAAAISDGRLRLEITDDGPGFPPDLLAQDIRAFVTHRPGGTGLGLSMVQRFARSLGGGLRLANVQPHGACVTLELPCGKAEHA